MSRQGNLKEHQTMNKKHSDATKQHHYAAPSARPVLDVNKEDSNVTKQRDQNEKSAQHNYAVDDKRKDARIEHTNGSTPRRDQ
jgi:hypothetical protein